MSNQTIHSLWLRDTFAEIFGVKKRLAAWALVTREQAEALCQQPSTASIIAFWLRMHGLLIDVRAWASKGEEDLGEVNFDHPLIPLNRRLVDSLAALHSALTHDELLFIEFRRDYHAHPFLHAYTHASQKGGQILTDYKPRITGQVVSREEVRQSVTRVLDAHGSEEAVAVAIAQRTLPLLIEVAQALESYALAD